MTPAPAVVRAVGAASSFELSLSLSSETLYGGWANELIPTDSAKMSIDRLRIRTGSAEIRDPNDVRIFLCGHSAHASPRIGGSLRALTEQRTEREKASCLE